MSLETLIRFSAELPSCDMAIGITITFQERCNYVLRTMSIIGVLILGTSVLKVGLTVRKHVHENRIRAAARSPSIKETSTAG